MNAAAAARDWLERHVTGAPPALRERMAAAIEGLEGAAATGGVPLLLARAAEECLRATLASPSERPAALHLLAADALLTHACQAAAAQGLDALETFTAEWGPARLARVGADGGPGAGTPPTSTGPEGVA